MRNEKHILVCDERGTVSLTDSSGSYTIGGFATSVSSKPTLLAAWAEIKRRLCGTEEFELKWSHFFVGRHQSSKPNPLISKDPGQWREDALWALNHLFEETDIVPITTIVKKSRVGTGLTKLTRKSRPVLDVDMILAVILGQFALYLQEHDAYEGEIWFDKLGSLQEERRRAEEFRNLLKRIGNSPFSAENRVIIQRVKPDVQFKDSRSEPFVQLADFVSGVIWAASEGDEWFIRGLLDRYAPGRRKTYGIVLLEA